MRLTNFLFVAATALLASCEATSAAKDSTQTKLSTMTSPNAIQSIDAVNGGKRFLRTTKTEKYEVDNDNDEDDAEEEERGNPLQSYISRHGQTWVKKWVGKVNGWAIAGKTPIQIKEKIQGFRSSLSLEAKDKYNLFLAAWLQLHPGGF